MEEWQWLTTPLAALAAVFVTWYLGKQNLSNARSDFEREAAKRGQEEGYFRGMVTERLATLSEGQRQLREELRQVRDGLQEVRGELGEVRTELGEVRVELGTVGSRVTALEASAT